MRVFYVDDSGNEGVTLIAAVTFEFESWPRVLRAWLGWRKWLWRQYQLPIDYEMHAQEFISGHGRIPPLDNPPDIDRNKGLRSQAYRGSLQQLNRQNELQVTAIARHGRNVKEVYAEFVDSIDSWLGVRNELGFCIVDGKDDSSYRPAHRALVLKTRSLLEDPLMQSSSHSQLIQIADLVSYAAFKHIDSEGRNPVIAGWYTELLADSFLDDEGLPPLDGP